MINFNHMFNYKLIMWLDLIIWLSDIRGCIYNSFAGGIIVQVIYNYDLHEKLISIIIKLRKGYFPRGPMNRGKITLSRFNNYGY